ncbi:MAG: bifunctional demethylmenaquinone methyltransferase/2-methoxy-6-polyprenyl-1,4-benzoquinol methylase UbiE [Planctomycetota bacterium]|nr:MAG: bifunctional demethylmenaquinone methyltransferase/2-methoxy-6-polyprenyl-1,4-benzoquinol methylase UbiE [Planctomycetota bacterium]
MPSAAEPAVPPPTSTKVDKSGPRVRRMFGEIAGRYDLLNHLLSLNIDRCWRRRTVHLVPPQPGMRILDLCTGTGDLALAYDRAAQGQATIVAADFCHEMLAIGRQKSQRAGAAGRISFIEADAQALPLPSGRFDIVCVAFGLRNVADADAGLAEMTRVCAPGGRVAVLEFTTPSSQPWKGLYGWYFRQVLPRIGQFICRNRESAYSYLPESVGQFPQYEALARRMERAGLTEVSFRGLTFGVATLYVGKKPA